MKSKRGYGTKLVWNSVVSTLRAPSNLRGEVKEEIAGTIDVQTATADVIDGLIVEQDRSQGARGASGWRAQRCVARR